MRPIVARAEAYARRELEDADSAHDWWHADRVRRLALRLAGEEGADELVVELAALLHDVADPKLGGSVDAVQNWLRAQAAPPELVSAVVEIVAGVSFRGAGVDDEPLSLEGQCVRDADRLDAIGAIGIARAFAFGGHKGRALHDPRLPPRPHATADDYLAAGSTTVNHFHEKLLLLAERMSTASGRRIAGHRHRVVQAFLNELYAEWDGTDGS